MDGASLLVLTLLAQSFEQRGFFENQAQFYQRTAPNDSGHAQDSGLLRWETSFKLEPWFTLSTSIDARADSHLQTERKARLDLDDRGTLRPAFSLRRFSATIHKGPVTFEIGRQFIRWGKADIVNFNDRFAPKDYLSNVVNSDFLGVAAARLMLSSGVDTVEFVWQPWFTPSRTPLLNQRWVSLPAEAAGLNIVDGGAQYPGKSQYGARWNHAGSDFEYSLVFFNGNNNLPFYNATFNPYTSTVTAQRFYPDLRLYGGDAALPLSWFTLKGEAAYYTSTTPNTDKYVLYVVQLERQVKEWSFVGGYAGEEVTHNATGAAPPQFTPDRGFARSFVGRAGLTIDTNRSMFLEAAVRAAGSYLHFEYSNGIGQHWRITGGWVWIRGDMTDFIGQYYRNSYGLLSLRYSF